MFHPLHAQVKTSPSFSDLEVLELVWNKLDVEVSSIWNIFLREKKITSSLRESKRNARKAKKKKKKKCSMHLNVRQMISDFKF
jgi:hypothetical protein